MRDGTKLAIDIYRPLDNVREGGQALPVVLLATPYHRSDLHDGRLSPGGPYLAGLPQMLILRGFVFATLDMRGHGASFGTSYAGGMESEHNPKDLADVIEWLAAQSWSNGNIGMLGCSSDGASAFWAASAMPAHLKAIAPCAAPVLDRYNNVRINGINPIDLIRNWDQMMLGLDVTAPAPPVDGDQGAVQLGAAIAEHKLSWDNGLGSFADARIERPFRDTPPVRPEFASGAQEGWSSLASYRTSRIPVLQIAGWRDLTINQSLAWYRSLARQGIAQRLIIGPWYHCEWYGSSLYPTKDVHLQWFDYWLKGSKNGALSMPPVTYYVAGAPQGSEWRSALSWPLPNVEARQYFLGNSAPGRTAGRVLARAARSGDRPDEYRVNYTVTGSPLGLPLSPSAVRVPNPGLQPIPAAPLDAKSLSYTSEPLTSNVEITGFPVVTLWASSSAQDLDFIVDLEDVDENGLATLLTDGALRASHRAINDAPFDNEGLPWHASLMRDSLSLSPTSPSKLAFALNPLSVYLAKGHRIRISINHFDRGRGLDTPEISPPPRVSLFHDSEHPSSITLPFVRAAHAGER